MFELQSPIRSCLYAELDGSNRPRSIVGSPALPTTRQPRAKPGHGSRHSTRRPKPPDHLGIVWIENYLNYYSNGLADYSNND